MLKNYDNHLSLIGRLLLAFVFLPAGISKIMNFGRTVGYITANGLPMPEVGAVIAILIEVGAGLALVLGYKTRLMSLLLAVFCVAAAVFFHNYWGMPADKMAMQQVMFNKNIGLAGGLLLLAVAGAGAFSLDARKKS
jgi:putative oxidoreductase